MRTLGVGWRVGGVVYPIRGYFDGQNPCHHILRIHIQRELLRSGFSEIL